MKDGSVLCLHYQPVHCSTKDAYTSEITSLAFNPCHEARRKKVCSVFRYGREVLNYIWSVKHIGEDGKYLTHDPMCELFPTEVKNILLSKVENISKI